MSKYILWLGSSVLCAFGFVAILQRLLFVPEYRERARYRNSYHDHSFHDGDLEIDLDDDMCLFHWRTDCGCFGAPVAIADVHDPYEIVLPFRERIEPPDWVDAWVAPQVKWVVKSKVNK
jgi:hypothetical protein